MIEIASLVLELLSFADVANQRIDADRSIGRGAIGMRGHFYPDRGVVHATKTKEVVGDGPFGGQTINEGGARLWVDKAGRVERANPGVAILAGIAEHHLKVGIGRNGGGRLRPKETDVDAFMNRLEQPCEGVGARLGQCYFPGGGAGVGVSVSGKRGR